MSDNISREDVIQGLLYAHTRSNLNTIEAHHARADILALLDVLIDSGVVERSKFEAQREAIAEKLRSDYLEQGMAVAIADQSTSKYDSSDTPQIDCASRIHLCKAACCRLSFALSKEDVEEGIVKWDLGRPYMIANREDGYCQHLDCSSKACGVYQHRPLTCRNYDCRQDKRIWQDFDQRIANPNVDKAGLTQPEDTAAD